MWEICIRWPQVYFGDAFLHVLVSTNPGADVVAFRYLADFAPPLMQIHSFPPDVLGLLIHFRPNSSFCLSICSKS